MPQPRDPAITIARGLGIILVVLAHCYDPFSWYPIYSYHMAFFFLLSGFVFNPAHRADPALLGNTLYCVNAPRLFPLYAAAGLFGPIGLTRGIAALQATIRRRLDCCSRPLADQGAPQ